MTGYSWSTPAVAMGAVTVNGPEDRPPKNAPASWDEIDWRACEGEVRRLRQRIFKASREQDWAKIRNLQKLMLRSRANTLVSVRQVTQRNAGRKTAGIDGEVALTPEARAGVAVRVHQSRSSDGPAAAASGGCACRVRPRDRSCGARVAAPVSEAVHAPAGVAAAGSVVLGLVGARGGRGGMLSARCCPAVWTCPGPELASGRCR